MIRPPVSGGHPFQTNTPARAAASAQLEEQTTITEIQINWGEFFDRLEGPEGCDFSEDGSWTCSGKGDFPLTRKLFGDMELSENQIEECIAHFAKHGGYCDCEVVFNGRDAYEREGRLKPAQ